MKLLHLLLFAAPAVALSCGPYFYPAPPTLDRFPERLPVKTMREILAETNPPPADAATFDQLSTEILSIGHQLDVPSRANLLGKIDETLKRNRAGDYRKRFANCLYDFRDLVANEGATASEMIHYADWRVQAMDWDDGFFRRRPSDEPWNTAPQKVAEFQRRWDRTFSETADRLKAEIAKAGSALKPHWLVQAGAWQFKYAHFDEAIHFFQQVIDEAPTHPRAEVARLMLARARIEEWRVAKEQARMKDEPAPDAVTEKFTAANDALDSYLAAHPKGRFALDIPGWRGGLARENGNPSGALEYFLQQMDVFDHPEIVRSAVHGFEECLEDLDPPKSGDEVEGDRSPSALPLEEIAARPLAALAVVYHCLDSESRRDFDDLLRRMDTVTASDVTDRYLPPMLKMRRAGLEVLPALATAVAKRKENYNGIWRPKYLAILAWASSECGEHLQAIRVCDLAGPELDDSDDLLFVRAVALQRAGKPAEAIVGFRRLNDKFPESPLAAEAPFRIATALRDEHESGLAAVELMKINIELQQRQGSREPVDDDPKTAGSVPLHIESELNQWIDTLLQFAPLAELERGLSDPNLAPEVSARLRRMIRLRRFAREDFTAAAQFAEPAEAEGSATKPENFRLSELAGDSWLETVDRLKSLAEEAAKTAPPKVRAGKLFALAEAWSSVRGRFTLPSLDDDWVFGSEYYKSWMLRRQNARLIGVSSAQAAEELHERDELRHAFRYYLRAADCERGTPLAARALWRANDALRGMAELSPWSGAQAFETNATTLSRQLHERLLKECPDSEEAKRLSVWWSFPPAAELRWMPEGGTSYNEEAAIADTFEGRKGHSGDSPVWQDYYEFKKPLAELAANAGTWDVAKLRREITTLREDFIPRLASSRGAWVINHLDDLALFMHEPGLTPSVRTKYFAARLAGGPPALDDPEMQPWRDYLTFLALVRERPVAEDGATGQRISRPMSVRMREFLAQFPHSRKREAALARLAIALVRESRVHTRVVRTEWPEAPIFTGYKKIEVTPGDPFDAKRVFAGLDAYEREFPDGRYAAEMRLWRGAASIDAGDWKTAVNLLVMTLDDKNERDLHLDAALNLADVFLRLLDEPDRRPEIIAAIRANGAAQERLHQFMHSDTLGARLCCMEGYLDERFAAGAPERH